MKKTASNPCSAHCLKERAARDARLPRDGSAAVFALPDLMPGEARRFDLRLDVAAETAVTFEGCEDFELDAADTGANIPVVRVGQSGDYGADLLANTATGTAVIQCKFYTHPVGYDAVKEAYTAKAIYHATAAFVVSNAAFTTQARKAARQLGVTLANHAEIAVLLG